ncbi:MAG TPA: response regulator transcription factor [Aggregatilineaceae bacterium]|jgi:CheY-like chemotaxis protein|nr:response regulator transcription factor [Aggregatilineaceae bacterium]
MAKKRLLIIEDDVDVSEMLVTFFESQDYEVFHAEEGAQGIALGRARFPNLILLDVMLPDMDGFDVCRALRTTTLTKYIPITFLTQRDSRADKVAGLELGADDYVTKPFDIEELRLRVQGSIRRASRDHLHETRTGLPSGPLVQAELTRLNGQTGWRHLDIRLTGFSAFREVYGFLAADEALGFTARVITEVVGELGTLNDFIGTPHEAGFVILTFAPDIGAFTGALNDRFNRRVKTLYNFADAERGYITVKSLTGEERKEPLMSLAIAQIERQRP